MNELPEDSPGSQNEDTESRRCPNCDSVIEVNQSDCPICGEQLSGYEEPAETVFIDSDGSGDTGSEHSQKPDDHLPGQPDDSPASIESTMEEKRSVLSSILLLGMIVLFGATAIWVFMNPDRISLALLPTATSIAPTITLTPTWTPLPLDTPLPVDTPTTTPVPLPTETPLPPRLHQVVPGETLFSLSLRYGVTLDSIAATNEIASDSGLQVSQQLVIPWPTATPPLARVAVEVGGETIVADPAGCRMYEIKGGDTFFGISAREKIPLEALMAVNRLTEQSIMQPGDSICLPELIRGGVLPPTPGPSPSPTSTEPPPGPQQLYPVRDANVTSLDGPLFLQWAAVKELAEDEWYMIEVTDLTSVDSYPNRGFTRHNSFQVPSSWRWSSPEVHRYRWRVQIVIVNGEREDGSFIYTFGGRSSADAFFNWLGAIPTPTPVPTVTQTPVPE